MVLKFLLVRVLLLALLLRTIPRFAGDSVQCLSPVKESWAKFGQSVITRCYMGSNPVGIP